MPCRALEAFGLRYDLPGGVASHCVLMPCRALEAFGLTAKPAGCYIQVIVLMPCRALEAFGHTRCIRIPQRFNERS